MLDFPGPPLVSGQQFAGANGVLYQYLLPPGVWLAVGQPSGVAGGDLAGTYPNPTIKSGVILTGDARLQASPAAGDNDTSIATTEFVQSVSGGATTTPNAVGNGIADDTAALQAACNYIGGLGGGVVLLGPKRYLIDSADLIVPTGVTLRGPWLMPGPGESGTFDPVAATGVLIVNPTYTIRLNGAGAAIERIMVLRKGLTKPVDQAARFALIQSFAGRGITIGLSDGTANQRVHDTSIRNVLIGGFQYGIYSDHNARMRIDYVFADNTNGIFLTFCTDMDYISNVHMWPFLTSGASLTTYTVSNATNAGGLIQITTSATHIFQTGDKHIVVADVGGVTAANGTWTVTRVDTTNFTLNGSVFAGVYTPATGTVNASPFFRDGVGFDLNITTDWGQLTTCFTYAYAIGFRVLNSNHVTLNNCGADAYAPAYDTSTVGIHITGTTSAATLLGCKTAAQGTGLKVDTTASVSDQTNVIGHRFWGNIVYAAQLLDANVTFNGISVQDRDDVNKYYGTMYIGDSAGTVAFVGGDLGANNVFEYQSASAPRPSCTNVVGGEVTAPLYEVVNTTAASAIVSRLERYNPTPAAADILSEQFLITDSAHAQVLIGRENYTAMSVTAGAMTSRRSWALLNAGTFVNALILDPTALQAGAHNTSSLGSSVSFWTNLYLSGFAKTGSTTVALLPAATAALTGARMFVTDANSTTFNATAVGGGANKMSVVCDGTIWKLG